MHQQYPVVLKLDGDSVIASFPDVPEAITVGSDEDNALAWAVDALVVALSGYIDNRRDIPRPSRPKPSQPTVALPPAITAKIAIYQTMRDQKVTQAELGQRMGIDARQVRRVLDLNHRTRLDQLESALRALGKQMVIDIQDAA